MLETAGMVSPDFHKGIFCCTECREDGNKRLKRSEIKELNESTDALLFRSKPSSCGVGIHFRSNKNGSLSVYEIVPNGTL